MTVSWEAIGVLAMLICLSGGTVAIYGRALVAELHDEMHAGTSALSSRLDLLNAKMESQNGRVGRIEEDIHGLREQDLELMNRLTYAMQEHAKVVQAIQADIERRIVLHQATCESYRPRTVTGP